MECDFLAFSPTGTLSLRSVVANLEEVSVAYPEYFEGGP